jgi:histidinol-phosphatase (PHP family)
MHSIGFSEHGPVPFQTSWNIKADRINEFITEIRRLKNIYSEKIEIYFGLEIDFISKLNEEILQSIRIERLNYTIGSIHFLGFLSDGKPWNTDGPEVLFDQGFKEVFQNDGKKLIENYYGDIINMIYGFKPDIIGHIDKIKLHNDGDKYFSEESDYYKKAVLNVLDEIKRAGCIVEFNTRGLYKHKNKQPYPSLWMLKEMHQRNIRVIISSDCHLINELVQEFPAAIKLLKEAGYKTLWQLEKGKWKEVALS